MKDKAGDHIMLTLGSSEHVGSNGYLALHVLTSVHGHLYRICVLVCVFTEVLIQSTLKVTGKPPNYGMNEILPGF